MGKMTLRILGCSLLLAAGLIGCSQPPGQGEHERALAAMQDEKYVVAKGLLEKALRLMPQGEASAVAYNDLGLVYLALQDAENATKAFRASRKVNPAFAEATYNLGVVTYRNGDLRLAARLFEEAARLDPEDVRALRFAGQAELDRKEWAAAEKLLKQALEMRPASASILTSLALARLRTAGPGEAVEHLEAAIRADPNYAPAYYNLALIRDRWLGENEEALHALENFLVKSGDEERIAQANRLMESLGQPVPMGISGAVTGEPMPDVPDAEAGDVDLADVLDDEIEPLIPSTSRPAEVVRRPVEAIGDPEPETSLTAFQRAKALATQGKRADAAELFRRAAILASKDGDQALQEQILRAGIIACEDDAGVLFDYGNLLYKQGRYDRSLRAFKQAVLRDPQWAEVYIGMAASARKSGQIEAAIAALNRALRIDRANATAMQELASIYEDLEDPKEAVRLYQEFIQRFPSHPDVGAARQRVEELAAQARAPAVADEPPDPGPAPVRAPANTVESSRARPTVSMPEPGGTFIQDAGPGDGRPRTQNPESAKDWFNRGMLYKARGDWDNAIFHFRKAVEQDSTFTVAYNELGVAFHEKGEMTSALQMYRRVLQLDPNLVDTRYNVALLYRESGKGERALEQIKQILAIRPEYAPAHYLLGIMYSEHPKTMYLAAKHFRIFLRLAPSHPAARSVQQWLDQHTPSSGG